MTYVECKIWNFQGDDDYCQKSRHKAMKEGHVHHTVKALIDISSSENFISKSLADKLGEKYGNYFKNKRVKNSLGTIHSLEISFRFNGKDRLVGSSDEVFNDFEVVKDPCKRAFGKADLVLGLPWLWLREAKIDIRKEGMKIYGDFVPFCKYSSTDESFYDSDSSESDSDFDYVPPEKKILKVKCVKKKIRNKKVKPSLDL
jgi:hypothetical protein